MYSGEAYDRPRKCYKSGTTVCVTWSGVTRDQIQVTAPSQGNENVQEESKENRQACETRLNRNRCLYIPDHNSWSSPTGNMFRKNIISLLTLAKPDRVVDSQD